MSDGFSRRVFLEMTAVGVGLGLPALAAGAEGGEARGTPAPGAARADDLPPRTLHLIGREEIARFRPGDVLVNVARAALVDTDALAQRLQRGDLYAAIDVFDREPLEQDAVLRTLPNAYLTPHRAGGTMASVRRTLDWLIDDLEAVLGGAPPKHALTASVLPSLDT